MDEDQVAEELVKAGWGIARGLALIALAICSDAAHHGADGHAVYGSARALLERAEQADKLEDEP